MKSSLSFEKAWFAASLLVLAFGYGFASHAWGLFPKTYVEQAWRQGRQAFQSSEIFQSSEKRPNVSTYDRVYDRAGVTNHDAEEVRPGLTLITSPWRDSIGWKHGLRLIDAQGRVLHEWEIDKERIFQSNRVRGSVTWSSIHGAHVLPNGDALVNFLYLGMLRVDACGDVLWTMRENNHHSIARVEDGSFWVPGASESRRSRSEGYPNGFPGLGEKKVWVDQLLRISGEGKVLQKIGVLDVLYDNDLERYLSKAWGPWGGTVLPNSGKYKADITHMNDIEPLSPSMAQEYPLFEAGDLLVSLRGPHLVFVLDPESMKVKWHTSESLSYQHDPDYIGDGWIGILDNNPDFTERGKMSGGSRIVAIQPHTDSTRILFPTPRSDSFYTAGHGKWQQLENENMLLTEARAGRAVEVTSDGKTVWEWIGKPFNESRVPLLTEATRVDLTREEVASWSCSSVDSVSTAQNQ